MEFQAKINLRKNKIFVQVEKAPVPCQYAFYLYHYEKQNDIKIILKKTKYAKESSYSFTVNDDGYYYVRCFVLTALEKKDIDTYTVLYLSASFKRDFKKTMATNLVTKNTINNPIDFFHFPMPQNDFCFISTKNKINTSSLNVFCTNSGFNCVLINRNPDWPTNNYLIYTNGNTQVGFKDNRIFSGYAWINGKFYLGQDDLSSEISSTIFNDEKCGIYTLFSIEEDSILITNDYFSYSKLFYFTQDDYLVVSNHYHLLLLTLSKLNINKELDDEIINVTFASNVTLIRQTFTERLMVKNTYMLNAINKILITKNGWTFPHKTIYSVILNSKHNFDIDDYSILLKSGASEIIANIQSVIDYGKFDDIVLDLSGGKDSRVNFAAATNIPESRKYIKLNTNKNEPEDMEIAIGINNAFGYDYCTKEDTMYINSPLDYLKKKRSYFCGYHYLWYLKTHHSYNMKKIHISGESFEAIAFRYYSDTAQELNLNNPTNLELCEAYALLLSKQSIINFTDVADSFIQLLCQQMDQVPGASSMEALDNIHLFYRGMTHAGNLDRFYYESAYCNTLQAPSLLKIKRMWINNFVENKIIWDITEVLNPILASMPYNADKNNVSRNNAENIMQIEDRYKKCKLSLNSDITRYVNAQKIRESTVEKIITENDKDEIENLGTIPDIVWDNCVLGIQKLLKYKNGRFKNTLCLPIYYYILSEKDDEVDIRITHNKIWSVLDCIDALNLR